MLTVDYGEMFSRIPKLKEKGEDPMLDLKLKTMALTALLLLVPTLLAACGDGDTDAGAGLTREEVQEIVRSDVAFVEGPRACSVPRWRRRCRPPSGECPNRSLA